MKITESLLIRNFLKTLTFKNKNSLNLEDDIFYDSKSKIIFSTDTYEENVHFLNSNNPKKFVKKIFRSTISDILCKGAQPKVYFLSLSLNKTNKKWLKVFSNELKVESKKFGLYLGGGDTIKSKKLSITISVLAYTTKTPVLRSKAKSNDDIYVTGNLGESYIGLLVNQKKKNLGKLNNHFIKIYENPNLPYKFSKYLHKFATSSIDISDGILKDLTSICKASKCAANLNYLTLPMSDNTRKLTFKKKINFFNIFSKGDDFQILFSSNKKYRKTISKLAKKTSTKVTRVGKILPGNFVKLSNSDKNISLTGKKIGYIHSF